MKTPIVKVLKQVRLCVVLAAVSVILLGCRLSYHWEAYQSPDNKFSVEIPAKMIFHPNGVSSNPDKWIFYICSFLDDPGLEKVVSSSELTDKMLDSHRNAILGHYHGQVISEQSISIQGFPAHEIVAKLRTIAYPPDSYLNLRLIMVHDRMYYLTVQTTRQESEKENVRRFFASFRLKTE